MAITTIREFLTQNGQDPNIFARLKLGDMVVSDWGCFGISVGDCVLDIKRFGSLVVMLQRRTYYSGYPGIRRATAISVYPDDKRAVYHAEDVYIDGGYQTHHLDRPTRDFQEILGATWKNDLILARVKGKQSEGELLCEPRRQRWVEARVKGLGIIETVRDLSADEVENAIEQLRQKYAGRENLIISDTGLVQS